MLIFSEYVFTVFINGVEREWKCSGENRTSYQETNYVVRFVHEV